MCYNSNMAREITQRQLRNESGQVMRGLDAGETFILVRAGVPIGKLTSLRRSVFTPRAAVIEAFESAPPVDYDRFRADLDAHIDQAPPPRA